MLPASEQSDLISDMLKRIIVGLISGMFIGPFLGLLYFAITYSPNCTYRDVADVQGMVGGAVFGTPAGGIVGLIWAGLHFYKRMRKPAFLLKHRTWRQRFLLAGVAAGSLILLFALIWIFYLGPAARSCQLP